MPSVVETEGIHLGEGLLGGPMVEGNAIAGDEDAGAIVAEATMNKNGFARSLAEQGKKLCDLRGRWIGKTADRNRNETDAESFGARAFQLAGVGRFAAQIDDGGDAEFFQFGKI